MFRATKRFIRRALSPPLHRPDVHLPFGLLGTDYGGWPLLHDTPTGALVYSFGVGRDISFDLAAIDRFSCNVHAFDPTPRSVAWIAQQSLPDTLRFHPIGLAAHDGEATFCPPDNDSHVSYTWTSGAVAAGAISAPVRRLATLVEDLGTATPDIVKLDIEGFEYAAVADILSGPHRPRQLLVEFHHGRCGFGNDDTRTSVAALRAAGYGLYYVSAAGREYAFRFRR